MTKQDKTEHIPIMRIDTNLITLHRLLKLSKCLKNHGFKKSRRFGIWVKTLGRLKQYPFTSYFRNVSPLSKSNKFRFQQYDYHLSNYLVNLSLDMLIDVMLIKKHQKTNVMLIIKNTTFDKIRHLREFGPLHNVVIEVAVSYGRYR